MQCSCTVSTCIDEEAALDMDFQYIVSEQNNEIKCCECGRILAEGEKFLHEVGAPADVMEALAEEAEELGESEWQIPEDELYSYNTCLDCLSIRDQFFSNGWFYEHMLDELFSHLETFGDKVFDEVISEDCIARLTPRAQEIVCRYIEDIWKRWEAENDTDSQTQEKAQ